MRLIVIVSLIPITFAWTSAIHFEIMQKAYDQATPTARRFLRHHFGENIDDIAKAAEWADSDDARLRYPHSEEFHFSHTPYRKCSEFVLDRDCGFDGSGRCLVTGIAEMVMRATDTRLTIHERADAIKFVLHLVADVHQPLHTGFAKDAGGVSIKIDISPSMSLHQFWDFALLSPEIDVEVPVPSKIQLSPSFTTIAEVIDYASLLATESSTLFTCHAAYQTDTGAFIVSGETLSPEYIESRARIANERVAHAVVRLVSLLDVMGTQFFENRARSISRPKLESKSPKVDTSNCFAVLGFDFAADEIADICEDSLEVYRPQKSANPVASAELSTSTPTPRQLTEIEILEEAMAEAARGRAAAREHAKSPSTTVAGVEFSSIVLIRRDAQYFLTRKDLVIQDPLYRAVAIISYKVKFAFGKKRFYVNFGVDTQLFGYEPISDVDFARVLLYLKHGEDVPEVAAAGLVTSGASGCAAAGGGCVPAAIRSVKAEVEAPRMTSHVMGRRVANGYKIEPPREEDELLDEWFAKADVQTVMWLSDLEKNTAKWKTKEEKYDFEFFSKFSQLVQYNSVGNIQGYFHRDTLLNTTNVHRRFNLFLVKNSGPDGFDQYYIIMDTAIYDGMITPRIQKGMYKLDGRKAADRHIIDRAPTLEKEMRDLNKLLNSGSGTKMKVIKDLVQYDSIIEAGMMRVIEWDIKPQEEYED